MDIVGKRYFYFLISGILILPGLIGLILWGMPLAIDFTGGSYAEFQFEAGSLPALQDVRDLYQDMEIKDATPSSSGEDTLIVRSEHITNAENAAVAEALSDFADGGEVKMVRFDTIGPTVGREIATRAVGAVALASVGIMLYIWYAFRGVKNAHRYGISAILAMLHDIAVVFGMQAILGHYLTWEVDTLFLTALLTVASFSVHDSIVVFDRIRENSRTHRRRPYAETVNTAINQTLARSINTQFTVFLTLLALALFGGATIRHFVVILIIGVLSGTYSSIFNAAPILVVWENKEWEDWFKFGSSKA